MGRVWSPTAWVNGAPNYETLYPLTLPATLRDPSAQALQSSRDFRTYFVF